MLYRILPIWVLVSATLFGTPLPTATGDQPGSKLAGESFSQQLCFSNTGSSTGYEPQFEIVTPAGIKLTSATFYGSPTIIHSETCYLNECNVTNPLISGQNSPLSPLDANESYYIVDFPIGSFPTALPEQCIDLTFTIENSGADIQIGQEKTIETQPLFALGETAMDDGNFTYGTTHDLRVIPNIYTLSKVNTGDEGECATGDSRHPITVTIAVDIAAGETVENLQIEDTLSGGMQFKTLTSDGGCTNTPPVEPSTSVPGGTLSLDCGNVTGVVGTDRTITYEYFIPEKDDQNVSILGPQGQWQTLTNMVVANAEVNGSALPPVDANASVVAKSIIISKSSEIEVDSAPAGFSPGDIIKYTLHMETSDYVTHQNLQIEDLLGDGQHFDKNSSYLPTYDIRSGNIDENGTFDASHYGDCNGSPDTTNGSCLVHFDLDAQLGGNREIQGPANIEIVFYAVIDEAYQVIHNGDKLAMGDVVENNVTVKNDINGSTGIPDGSHTDNTIADSNLTKSIYKINCQDPGTNNVIKPGDTVTYRLKGSLPVESFYDLSLTDFLPSPFFDATEITDGPDSNSSCPQPGHWGTGPEHELNSSVADYTFEINASQNSLKWTMKDEFDSNNSAVVDLLFTVTATHKPMADGLSLANIALSRHRSASDMVFIEGGLVNVVSAEPFVEINKGIVSSSNPNSSPVSPPKDYTSVMDNVDANDTITYVIHLKNNGHATAYDINITDRMSRPAMTCGTIQFSSDDTNSSGSGDLFGGTYTVNELGEGKYVDINYTCVVHQDANPGEDIDNNATLTGYASKSGGANFVAKLIQSRTKLMMEENTALTKTFIGSSLPDTSGTSLNPGEIAYFEINATLGEGTYRDFNISDATCDTPPVLDSSSANVHFNGNDLVVDGTSGTSTGSVIYKCAYQTTVINPATSNTATMHANNISDVHSNIVNWTVTSPDANPSKVMNPNDADAGDTITVTMNWDSNNTANPSYQCHITDKLDAIFDWTSISITQIPAGYNCDANSSTGIVTCEYNNTTIPCGPGPVEFTVKIKDDITIGGNIENKIEFKGKTLPSDHNNTTDPNYNGDTDKNATALLNLYTPQKPIKIFTATSENFTDPGDVDLNSTPPIAVGEVIDVQITFGFYEGTTLDVDLDEVFDTQVFSYIPGTMQLMRSSTNLEVEESDINASFGGGSGNFVSVDDSKLTVNSNERMRLHLGDVYHTNATGSKVAETLTWRFRVKVRNEALVQAGYILKDYGHVRFTDGVSGDQRGTNSDIREAIIVEPLAAITKDVNQTTVQAGTSLKYTIQVCNDEQNSTSNNQHATSGFNWIVSDRIPDDIELVNGPLVDTNSTGAIVDTSASSGQDINATIDRLHRGQCISISYDAKVKTTANYGQIMTNTARYQTTSLPGTYGSENNLTTLSDTLPGEVNGKRTGTGGVNDLNGNDDATVTVGKGTIEKVLLSHTGHYAIGEQAHYQVVVGLPKGESNNFKVIDTLPTGLHYESATVIHDSNVSYSGTPLPAIISGNTIIFDFGDINTTQPSTILIDYNVTIENNLSNQDGIVLTNNVKTTYDDPNVAGDDNITLVPAALPTITVGEPNLEIQKSILSGAANAQAGSVVQWEVVISNASANGAHTTAFAVDWIDTLPSHLAQIQNYTLVTTGHPKFTGTNDDLNSSAFIANNTTLALQEFDLPVDATVTVTFESIVQNDAVAGEIQTNHTQAEYLSVLGADGSLLGGRNSSLDCGDDDNGSALNNYCESATSDLIIEAGIAVDKNLQGTQVNYTIGQKVTYKMRVSLIEGVTPNVILTDTLPDGLSYVSHQCEDAGGTSMQFDCNLTSGASNPVVIEFGDVDNPADNNNSNDYIDVTLEVLVQNINVNQNGNIKTNKVKITSDANNTVPEVFADKNITIVEPDLNITKTVSPDNQSAGDIVTYTVVVRHTSGVSSSDAYDVNLTDVLPVGLTYIQGSGEPTGQIDDNGQILTFGISYLALGDTKIFTYRARIDANLSAGVSLINDVNATYGSLPDANGTQDGARNGSDRPDANGLNNYFRHAEAELVVNRDELNVTKTVQWKEDRNNDGLVSAGDYLEYNLSVVNHLGYDVGDLNISDTLPPEVTLLLNTLTITINGTTYVITSAWTETPPGSGVFVYIEGSIGRYTYDSNLNILEILWNEILRAGESMEIGFDTKINDGNVTEIVFADGNTTTLDAKQAVTAGTVISNRFIVDSNRTVPSASNDANTTTDQRGVAATPEKTISGSDQDFTEGDYVAIGEVIDVTLTFRFSGGTTKNVVLRDNFDPQHFAYVTGETRLIRSSTAIHVSQSDLNSSFEPNDLNISVDDSLIAADANGFALDIGDVLNTHYDDMKPTETLTFTFKLRIRNNSEVQQGDWLEDNASVMYDKYVSPTEPNKEETLQTKPIPVFVMEPNVELIKTVLPGTAKAGDVVIYELKVCNDERNDTQANPHVATGFDWVVTDVIPDELNPESITVDTNGTAANVTASFSGQVLNATIDQLKRGECISIEYNVTVTGAAEFNQTLVNEANVTTTSLPGSIPGERTGTGVLPNDLNASAQAHLNIEVPKIEKLILHNNSDDPYAIGDTVAYRLSISYTGSSEKLKVTENFPVGLKYTAHSATFVLPGGGSMGSDVNVTHNPPLESNGTQPNQVIFDIGDFNVSTAGTIYLDLNATVEDIASNVDGTELTNSMVVEFENPNTHLPVSLHADSDKVTVGEPDIHVTKKITTDLSVPKSAGDTISYEIVIENRGTTPAFYVEWADKVPVHTGEIQNAHLNIVSGVAYDTNTTTVITDANFSITTVDEPDDKIMLVPFDLSVGGRIVITFDTIIQPNVIPAETLVNKTAATTRSTVFGGRTHTSATDSGKYAAVANVSFSINQLPEAADDGCYRVTSYAAYTWDIGKNDKLGDGSRAEHTWRLITAPHHGTVSISKDGYATYTPNANYSGSDSFRYELEDSNGDKSQANVCIDVECASSQHSDGGDSYTIWSIFALLFLTGLIGIYSIKREEKGITHE